MKDPLGYIIDKWDLRHSPKSWMPIFIPNTTRRSLNHLYNELGYRVGAEIGVNKGSNALRILRSNPELKLHLIDPWILYEGMNDFYQGCERTDAYNITRRRMEGYNVEIIKEFSMDAVKRFEDESLDFVYIDGNHEWPYVTQDIFYWAQKVKPGGIVAGHDYLTNPRAGKFNEVTAAVDGYTKAFNIKHWFVVDKGDFPDNPGSWFWVKT